MTSKLSRAAAVALILASGVSTTALAQARRAAPARAATPATGGAGNAAAQITNGPAIPGVCIFSSEGALALSSVGKAANARMQQLQAQAQAELTAQSTPLENDAKAYQARSASLTPEQRTQQEAALGQRAQTFRQLQQTRSQELEYTASHVRQRINQAVGPIAAAVYQERHCSMLISGDAVMLANPAMDITQAVVAQLNTKMPTITFDRETPPAGAAPAQR